MTVGGSDASLRVIVADDQTIVREGLVTMLDLLPDITVVGSATNGVEAITLVETYRPDAALVDLHMPVLDGIETTKRLSAGHPDVAVIVLTTYADDASILAALRAGARGYLTKDAGRADIARALHAAVSGQSVLDQTVQTALLRALTGIDPTQHSGPAPTPTPPQPLPDGLTSREAEVLRLIAKGLTNGQIANMLYISSHTIKSHINRIFAKTGSQTRTDAIRYAQQHLADPGS
jgi:DNA-binding NarL/FixJ family response regulator